MSIGGKRRGIGSAGLALALAALATPARAEPAAEASRPAVAGPTGTADSDVIALDPLEATAESGRMGSAGGGPGWQGASDRVYDTPGGVAEIGRQAIDERGGARNSGDLLRGVPGVNAVMDRQNPGLNVNIRGLQDQGRVNMSIDGARQNFQQSGHGATAFAFFDPELIGGVEIDKGPSSLAGGAGVIGGVVNFRTLDFADVALPEKDYGVRLNATSGANAFDFNGSLAAAAKVSENFDFVAAVGRKKLGEYEIGKRGEVAGGPDGEKAEFTTQDQWSWLGKATATFDDHKLTLSYTGLSAKFGTGTGEYIDTNDVTNHTAVADWRWTPGNWWADLNAKLYYTRTQDEQFRPARLTYDAFNVDYKIDTFGGSVSNTSRFSASVFDVALTYGAEYFIDKARTRSVGDDPADDPDGAWFGSNPVGDRGVGGAFARAEVKHGDWLQVLAGVRYDRYDLDGKGSVYDAPLGGCANPINRACPRGFKVDESGGRVSPTATIAVTPMQGVQIYASYEQGFRPPTIMETVLGGTHIGGVGLNFAPNPDLKPEVSRTYEAGLNLKFDGVLREDDAFRAKASVYHTDVDNFITQGQYSPSPSVYFARYVNLNSNTKLRGIDLEANYDAGFAYMGVSASLIDATYKRDFDAGPNNPYPNILGIYLAPKSKYVLDGGVRFLDRRLTIGGRVTHVTPEDIISTQPSLYKVEKYTLIDLYAHLKVNDNVNFRAAVENVRDVAYVDAMGSRISPSPGRTFTLGATVRF